MNRKCVLTSVAGFAVMAACNLHAAQPRYPERPVRVLVPAPPGGTVDLVARTLSPKLSESLNGQFVVDNRAGAGGVIAAELLTSAAPDGYTLSALYTAFTTNAALRAKPSYDPVNGIAPIAMVAESPLVLSIYPGLGVGSVKDLISLAKSRKLLYGSAGNGTGSHILAELMKSMVGVDITHVPYKGAAVAMTAVVAGEVHFQFTGPVAVLGLAKSGRVKNIAVTSLKRNSTMPEIPTMDESGVPGFEAVNWFGIAAPAKTPLPVITLLNAEILKALKSRDVIERLGGQGSEVVGSTPEYLGEFIKRDVEKWRKVVKSANIVPD
jgi:tripartite-type tricarboxylate transporter receptor subunit TctC